MFYFPHSIIELKMRVGLLMICLLSCSMCLNAQLGRTSGFIYEVLSNDPRMDPAFTLNFEALHGHFAPANNAGNTLNFGFWGVAQPGAKWGLDYLVRLSYLSISQVSSETPFQLQGEFGGHFIIAKNVRTVKTRLTAHKVSDFVGNVEYRSKSIVRKLPTTVYSLFGLRGGYFVRQSGLSIEDSSPLFTKFDYLTAQHNSTGLYAGLLLRYTMNTYITSMYGKQSNGKVIEVYGDVLTFLSDEFTSLSMGADFGQDITANVVQLSREPSTVGWRIGVRSYLTQKYEDASSNRKGKRQGKPVFVGVTAEMGGIPYQGFYVSCGFSFNLASKGRALDIPLN